MTKPETKAWRCNVCGYVHYGDEPPECCAVCGAAASEFEIYAEASAAPRQQPVGQWSCMICHYTHSGDAPPDICPVCGAAADKFEPAPQQVAVTASKPTTVVIVGAGIAGLSAAQTVRETSPHARVILLGKEKHAPYYRLNLTRYLAGEISDNDLPVHAPGWYEENRIELRYDTEAVAIQPNDKTVELANGEKIAFDKLVLASGAHPWIPPIAGADKAGVYTVRTRDDAKCIIDKVRRGMKCACIGGGILGIEIAAALARHGVDLTMLESFPWLMPRQLNQHGGQVLQDSIAALGVQVRTQARIKEICGGGHATGVILEDGGHIDADMVVVTAGVRANTHLARKAGLKVANGIVVDRHLTTSHPDILAAGDVAEYQGNLYGLWAPAQYQGNIAGLNALGIEAEFGGIPRSNTLKVLDIPLFSIGQIEAQDGSYLSVSRQEAGKYSYFLFRDNRLVGSILIGDTAIAPKLKKLVEMGTDLRQFLQQQPDARQVAAFVAEA